MMQQRSLRLDDDLDRFIDEQLARKEYVSADDVVAAGLKLLRKQAAQSDAIAETFAHPDGRPMAMDELREAIREGEESGVAEEVDFDELLAEVEAEVRNERSERR